MDPKHWFKENFQAKNNSEKIDEEKIRHYLLEIRSDLNHICPNCESESKFWVAKSRALLVCSNCDYQISPTAGTLLHRKRNLSGWIKAFWEVAAPGGISGGKLAKKSGLSKKTSRKALDLFRTLMSLADQPLLEGKVQVDLTTFEKKEYSRSVLLACEVVDQGLGRLTWVDGVEGEVEDFLSDCLAEGATVILPCNLGTIPEISSVKVHMNSGKKGSEMSAVSALYDDFRRWYRSDHRYRGFPNNFAPCLNEYNWRLARGALESNPTDFGSRWERRKRFEELLEMALDHTLE